MNHEKLLKSLIEIKSYSSAEDELRRYISAWFEQKGISTVEQEGNLLVRIEGKNTSKAIIFNSHMDTVDEGDEKWQFGAWNPTKVEDKIIGLGASDMKSGLAASMLLAGEYSESKPPTDLWFTYVVREEKDGLGTMSFAEWFAKNGYLKKYSDIAGIFTEPTSNKEIEHGHRGNMFIKITTHGDSGHAARPHLLEKHAVREMIKFSDLLRKNNDAWKKEFKSDIFEPPTIGEMTSIQAGVGVDSSGKEIEVKSPNKFPSTCSATFDVRTTPDFHKVAFERIKKLGESFSAEVSYAFPPVPAGFTDPKEKIVRVTNGVVRGATLTVSQASADLGFFTAKGIKAIIFGPGIKDQCHKLNEFTYPAQIPQAVEIYKQIIKAWAK